jgi:hypothetical protein
MLIGPFSRMTGPPELPGVVLLGVRDLRPEALLFGSTDPDLRRTGTGIPVVPREGERPLDNEGGEIGGVGVGEVEFACVGEAGVKLEVLMVIEGDMGLSVS